MYNDVIREREIEREGGGSRRSMDLYIWNRLFLSEKRVFRANGIAYLRHSDVSYLKMTFNFSSAPFTFTATSIWGKYVFLHSAKVSYRKNVFLSERSCVAIGLYP